MKCYRLVSCIMHKVLLQLIPCSFLYSNNKLSMYLKPLSLVKRNSSKDTADRKSKWVCSYDETPGMHLSHALAYQVDYYELFFPVPISQSHCSLLWCPVITLLGQVPLRKDIHTALTCSIFTARWDRAIMFPGVAAIIRTRCHTFSASHRSPPQDGMWRRYLGYVIWRVTWVLNKVTSIYIRVKIN